MRPANMVLKVNLLPSDVAVDDPELTWAELAVEGDEEAEEEDEDEE